MCVTQHVLMIRKVHHTESLVDSIQGLQSQTIHVENFTSVAKATNKAKQSMSSVLTNEGNVLFVYHYRNLCMLIN